MLRRLYAYLLLLALPLLLNTCTLGCQKCKDRLFTPALRAFFMDFKEGSYWIYRNTQNGDLDSVYFVSQNVYEQTTPNPECRQEYCVVRFKGIAAGLRFGYYIKGWNSDLENHDSDIVFQGDYDINKLGDLSLSGQTYRDIVQIDNCCLTKSCYGCQFNDFRFIRLSFARDIGLVRWEAENHPQYGNATYELVRYKVLR